MENESNSLLKVDNLSVTFNSENKISKAVKSISFEIKKSEIIALVGESGSGKSVTALSLTGLIKHLGNPDVSGTVFWNEQGSSNNLLHLSETELRKYRGAKIGMVFQEPGAALNPVLTCGYQVVEAIKAHQNISYESAKKKTLEIFEYVKLPEVERIFNSYPHQISGGQKQRIVISIAIANDPKLIIADEPTTALDASVRTIVLELFLKLRDEKNTSILLISHDLDLVRKYADSVVVMYKGEIMETGSVKDIFNNPQHPYTKALMNVRPSLDKKFKRLATIGEDFKIDYSEIESEKETLSRIENLEKNHPWMIAENIHTRFSSRKNFWGNTIKWTLAVNGVSFDLYKGESLGILGESGSGKSTLARTILGLESSSEGRAVFEGEDIFSISQSKRNLLKKRFQIIFQDPYSSLNPRMKIGQAIMEPMIAHNLNGEKQNRIKKVKELLKAVGLDESSFDKYPHEFSGGQRQRISIARALAVEPELLICDESVSALDVSIQAQIINLLKDLQRSFGLSYLFISHDLAVVRQMCDHILVLKDGKVVEYSDVITLFKNPKDEYTKSLIHASI
jgi:peptide/nickel transport system ATP-binding protein